MPKQVYDEISKVPPLLSRIDNMKEAGQLTVQNIEVGTEEYKDYCSLAIYPPTGSKIIGKGEASAIALAKKHKGILASNNLRDVAALVKKYDLNHITTGDILVAALKKWNHNRGGG